MAHEQIQYESLNKPSIHWGRIVLFGIVLPLGPLLLLWDGKFDSMVIILFVTAIVFSIVLRWHTHIMRRALKRGFIDAKRHFTQQGFNADFEHSPQLLIDSKARKVAFVETGNALYDLYDLPDILNWEHHWDNDTKTYFSGLTGRIIKTHEKPINNVLLFKTNNPHKPLIKIRLPNHVQGELWMARLNAMING